MTLFSPRKRNPGGTGATLFLPRKGRSDSGSRPSSLPPELAEQATRRLRLIAFVYSSVFFLADVFPDLATGHLAQLFAKPSNWVATVLSILCGLVVAVLAGSRRVPPETKINLGLVFQVAATYGIALAMYLDVPKGLPPVTFHVLSPSWPAIWMLFYFIVVPAPPRRALLALVASASAAPIVIGLAISRLGYWGQMDPVMFFFMNVFPYMICAAMAYIGARIVFRLGTDVSRALELGSYRLVERLGQGGMGEVWRASHQFLAREAAIKFIRPEAIAGSSPEAAQLLLKRFELEARTTAALTSAHTIDLYDFGVTQEGRFYYVMELLDGVDGELLVRRFGALAPARVIHLLKQICQSLDEAHSKGLIHRDVKPANIYVCRSGRVCDFVKVLDFGLVGQRLEAGPDLKLTQPEQAIGTPAFMAPEMAMGREVDGRADLYGLGCVAYWLLTGRSVFEGTSYFEVVAKHMHETPDPPSRHAPQSLPAELDALVLECLAKDPALRPASARELEKRLKAIAMEPWQDEQAEAWWNAHLSGEARRAEPELQMV
jgi:serine/threonine-protein kinase